MSVRLLVNLKQLPDPQANRNVPGADSLVIDSVIDREARPAGRCISWDRS